MLSKSTSKQPLRRSFILILNLYDFCPAQSPWQPQGRKCIARMRKSSRRAKLAQFTPSKDDFTDADGDSGFDFSTSAIQKKKRKKTKHQRRSSWLHHDSSRTSMYECYRKHNLRRKEANPKAFINSGIYNYYKITLLNRVEVYLTQWVILHVVSGAPGRSNTSLPLALPHQWRRRPTSTERFNKEGQQLFRTHRSPPKAETKATLPD